jgi:hypothetical protein
MICLSPEAASAGDEPLRLRRPGWAWGLAGLALVHATALLGATLAAMALLGLSWGVAEGFSAPAVVATILTAVELGPPLRRGQGLTLRRCLIGGARAWGAVGAAWPLVWALEGLAAGLPGELWLEALRVTGGGVIGALAGAIAAFAAARTVLVRV